MTALTDEQSDEKIKKLEGKVAKLELEADKVEKYARRSNLGFSGLGVVPRLKSRKSFMKCTEPINTTAKAGRMELWRERLEPLDASVHLNISADEHLPVFSK